MTLVISAVPNAQNEAEALKKGTMTAGELIEILEDYDLDTPIIIRHNPMYHVYSTIRRRDIDEDDGDYSDEDCDDECFEDYDDDGE